MEAQSVSRYPDLPQRLVTVARLMDADAEFYVGSIRIPNHETNTRDGSAAGGHAAKNIRLRRIDSFPEVRIPL